MRACLNLVALKLQAEEVSWPPGIILSIPQPFMESGRSLMIHRPNSDGKELKFFPEKKIRFESSAHTF